ncbi:SAM-dependent methyltransferase [Candidatus Electrothrix sp.]|uniref:SAM-dependent methyltransferase n=1 Tax=Candidatus Electrothrix sp. TaxID=2170559 RepID=UPI0040560BB7
MTAIVHDVMNKNIIEYYNNFTFPHQMYSLGTNNIHYGYWEDGHWEGVQRKDHRDALERMNAVMAKAARISVEDTVLDAGCGTGGSAVWLAKTMKCRVTGVTLCEQHIPLAERFARKNNVDHLCQFFCKDFSDTCLDPVSFDVVWVLESSCYALDKKKLLEEAARLLKPGGRLVVADGFLQQAELSEDEQEMLNRWMLGWAVPNVLNVDQFGRYLEESGFEDISFDEITENILPTSLRMHQVAKVVYPVAAWSHRLGVCSEQAKNHWYSTRDQFHFFADSISCYGIFLARKAG